MNTLAGPKFFLLLILLLVGLAQPGQSVEPTACSPCSASGECHVCEGDGLRYDGSTCSMCSGSKKCYYCSGYGKY